MPPRPPASRPIAVLRSPAGDEYALVCYAINCVGVTRNGLPVPQFVWALDDIDACVDAALALAGIAFDGTALSRRPAGR